MDRRGADTVLRFGRGDVDFSRVHVGDRVWKTNDPELDRRVRATFEGDQIRTVATEIGTLVTVTIRMTIDSGSTSFTLLVPTVHLSSSNHATLHTEGITTIHRFSIVPAFNQGQTELYTVTPLTGTASFVVF